MSKLPSGCSLKWEKFTSLFDRFKMTSAKQRESGKQQQSKVFQSKFLNIPERDDFVLFLFSPRPPEPLSVPSTGWEESFSTLPSRIFTFSASSSIHSFELRTVWSSSSIELWQAARPVINCCVVSREDRGVDPLDWTEDDDRPTALTRELEPL